MRESHPIFVEGSLSWLLAPPVERSVTKRITRTESSAVVNRSETALSQTLLNQGASLSRISSSVEELHDTMADLKQSFKSLRLELNTTPSIRGQGSHGDDAMEMLRTVLKELQSKSDEIEKLKLENESLKLRYEVVQRRQISATPVTQRALEEPSILEVQSPGFLTDRGRRDLLVATSPMPIADSFEEEDNEVMDQHATSDEAAIEMPIPPVKVPIKPPANNSLSSARPAAAEHEQASTIVPAAPRSRRDSGEPATKRRRLAPTEELESASSGLAKNQQQPPAKEKKPRGRKPGWRRSLQSLPSEEPLTPTTAEPAGGGLETAETGKNQPNSALDTTRASAENTQQQQQQEQPKVVRRRRGRSKASSPSRSTTTTTTSQVSSRTRRATKSQGDDDNAEEAEEALNAKVPKELTLENKIPERAAGFEVAVNVAELTPESVVNENELFAHIQRREAPDDDETEKQHQAKVAARDLLAKAAMEREEAMAYG